MGWTVVQAIDYYAERYNLDATAVKIVALGEGGLEWHAGDDGDGGTSFGPFQLHIGGALPKEYWNDPAAGIAFANSVAGVEYALRKMAEIGAAGLTGLEAIDRIIGRKDKNGNYLYGFEKPDDPVASFARAKRTYDAWKNGKIDFNDYQETTTKGNGPTDPSGSGSTQTGFVFPVRGRHKFTDDWGGTRSAGATGGTGKHQGNDIFAPKGTPVVAAEDGQITRIGWNTYGGNRLWINGTFYYAHLDGYAPGIRQGSYVKAGDVIGYVGNTGDARTTPPHLHFAYDPQGTHGGTNGANFVNPYPLLTGAGQPPAADPDSIPSKYQGPVASPTELDDGQNEFLFGKQEPPARGLVPAMSGPVAVGANVQEHTALSPVDGKLRDQWRLIADQPLSSPEASRYAGLFDA